MSVRLSLRVVALAVCLVCAFCGLQLVIAEQVDVALSLKEHIESRLKAYEAANETVADDDDDEEDDDDGDALLALAGKQDVVVKADDDILVQLKTEHKMSFDCWERKQETCESEYCVWKNDECHISPASLDAICSFYCEASLCSQPLHDIAPADFSCPVRPSAMSGLCRSIQTQTNCELQRGLCTWTNGSCKDAPTCCSLSARYCTTKKKKALNKALKRCTNLTNAKAMCTFVKNQC